MSDILFRDAHLDDLPTIVDIYNSTIASRMVTADLEKVRVADRLDWFNKHSSLRRPIWMITTAEHEIVGWVSFQDFYGRIAYQHTAELSIYLSESARGKGIGTKAVSLCIEKAKDLSIHTLVGYIFDHNTPSIKLFEKSGFTVWGHLPNIAELDGIERGVLIFGQRVDQQPLVV